MSSDKKGPLRIDDSSCDNGFLMCSDEEDDCSSGQEVDSFMICCGTERTDDVVEDLCSAKKGLIPDEQSSDIVISTTFWAAMVLSVCMVIVLLVSYCRAAPWSEIRCVLMYGLGSILKRQIFYGTNFMIGWYWFLPRYLEMTPDEVHSFYMPGPVPVDDWIAKYGEDRILIRDGLQRKVPHLLSLTADTVLWTLALNWTRTSPIALIAISLVYRGTVALLQGVTLYLSPDLPEGWWFFLSSWLFSSARIRDGRLRWQNLTYVVLGTLWGLLMAQVIWLLFLIQLFDPLESALLLQLVWLPVAVGDAMAEIIGSCFGRHHFQVTGVGEKNTKTLEGVVAMFISTLMACMVAVLHAWHNSMIVTGGFWDWIVVCHLLAIVATIAETWSPRSTDNFTIPVSCCLILYIFGCLHGDARQI